MPHAPPLPPSPITTQTIGVFSNAISYIESEIERPTPRSSDSIPGYAPGVSMNTITGSLNFAASFIFSIAL